MCMSAEKDRPPQLAWEEAADIPRARVLHVGSRIGSIAWSSDARLIAIQTATTDAEKRRRWTIQLHDAQSGKLQSTYRYCQRTITNCDEDAGTKILGAVFARQ